MSTSSVEKPIDVEVPPGYWMRDDVYQPEPVMPMWRSVCMAPINVALESAFEGGGKREFRDIGGWRYAQTTMMSPEDPRFMSWLESFIEFLSNHGELRYAQLWEKDWEPRQKRMIAELQKIDLSELSDVALADHISSVLMPFLEESLRYQTALELSFVYSTASLADSCRESLGSDDALITGLLCGLSEETTEQTRRLSALAQIAGDNPRTGSVLKVIAKDTREKLAMTDPVFSAAFDAYLCDYGCRMLHHSIHHPTLGEKPDLVLRLVSEQLTRPFDHQAVELSLAEKRAAARKSARAALALKPEDERERFERALASAEVIYPLKEGAEYATMEAPVALMRYALLELGARLVRRNHLEDRGDVFFLELDEALQAFESEQDARALVLQRKAQRTWAETHKGPRSYGQHIAPPPDSLPPEILRFVRGSLWVADQIYGDLSRAATGSPREIHGMAASPGTYTGPARIILNESEFGRLNPGDVLVCRITSPSWAVLFPNVGAIVTDVGGVLSHPAIIAREYGVPAVVATNGATTLLKDGQAVTVDGTAGTITAI